MSLLFEIFNISPGSSKNAGRVEAASSQGHGSFESVDGHLLWSSAGWIYDLGPRTSCGAHRAADSGGGSLGDGGKMEEKP